MANIAIVTLLGVFLRWCVSLHSYSGEGKPPMFGDYEAQRHWQEVTVNLPLKEWYVNTTDNDLLYWGLDYPPLTAYHSYLCGQVAKWINPDFVELHTSRGYESYDHKLFMRYSVFLVDLLVYIPAAFLFLKALSGSSAKRLNGMMEYAYLLLYPGQYLIDYGHFQYNNASLGFFVGAVGAFMKGQDHFGSVLFCLALNYKQMELYHALPIFFYLLGVCFRQGSFFGFLRKITTIGICVLASFGVIWLPFLSDATLVQQVVQRVFPVKRGVFEDKVANFWCTLHTFMKVKYLVNNTNMALICLLLTVVCMIPSSLQLVINPTSRHLRYALINGALVFFLFSFHVHEKSILLVAIPVCLMISEELLVTSWFLVVSVFSMMPLLIKDGLFLPTVAMIAIFQLMVHFFIRASYSEQARKTSAFVWTYRSYNLSLVGMWFLTIVSMTVTPPPRLPHLFSVLLSVYSFGHFVVFCVYFHYCQFTIKYKRKQKAE